MADIETALRLLAEDMRSIEAERQQRINSGDDHAQADRNAAQLALTELVTFLLKHGIELEPLVRLLNELAALTEGSSPSALLSPARTPHRRPDPPAVEAVKGRLAAIMEYRQKAGSSRKEAREWIVRHMPPAMSTRLGNLKPATVDSWLSKWGGERGASSGHGREAYLLMRDILKERSPTESQLRTIMETLAEKLPSGESI